ncbi:MAG: citrate lyase subunit alpha, partial [Erysipelothrix sp.]|nr:citrate lyase subunit alpha [Erysipelothrix sp.]
DVDALVTEFGIAIHPRHQALIDTLKATTSLPIKTIRELYDFAISLTGQPNKIAFEERVVGVSLYRDGTKLDDLYQITETSD